MKIALTNRQEGSLLIAPAGTGKCDGLLADTSSSYIVIPPSECRRIDEGFAVLLDALKRDLLRAGLAFE